LNTTPGGIDLSELLASSDPIIFDCPGIAVDVGGEILGIDASALFVAGAAPNASWIVPIAGVATVGIIIFALRKRIES
jgi:hypothetical protein